MNWPIGCGWSASLPGSRLAKPDRQESDINAELGLTVAAVWRGRETITIPKSNQMIYPADELLIVGREERLQQLLAWGNELIEGGAQRGKSGRTAD